MTAATFLTLRRCRLPAILLRLGAAIAHLERHARSRVVARKEVGSTLKNSGIVPMWQFTRLAKVRRQRHQRLAVPQRQLQVLAHPYMGSVVANSFPDMHAARLAAFATSKATGIANVYPAWGRHGPHPGQLRPQPQASRHPHLLQAIAPVQRAQHGTAVLGALLVVRAAFAHKILAATTHTSLLVEALVQGVAGVAQDRAILASTLSLSRMDGRSRLINRQRVRIHTVRLHTCSFAMDSNTANAGRKT